MNGDWSLVNIPVPLFIKQYELVPANGGDTLKLSESNTNYSVTLPVGCLPQKPEISTGPYNL